LLSKLVKPDLSGKLVPRVVFTTFAEKLLSGIKVGLVIAPAGYGKSTLLSQSFDILINRDVHCTWLSLDTEDNDPLRFLSHLLAACHMLSPQDFNAGTENLGANSKTSIDYIVTDTITRLEALDFRHAIFIDDYHVISNPEVNEMLERLVLYSPRTTMFVIASRKEPKLAFNTLKMRDAICHLSTEDLAFAQSESEQFLNEAKQLGLNSQQVESLVSRTEGWIAGLQLASLALAGRTDPEKFIEEFSGTDRDITDYLGEAVLSKQSDDTRHFLLWTSLLDRMSADLANAVLGIESAQAILEQLEGRNLFVIPLDRDRTWYRYHHLFGDFLKAQLAKKHPGVAEMICQSALTWCVKQGFQHEAINYALRGRFYYQAIELIAGIAKDLLQISGEHWTMLHWLQQLPEDYPLKRPEIAVAYSWSLVFTRQYTEARTLLNKQEKHCEQQATPLEIESVRELHYGIKLNKCLLETACDNTERASELLKEWLNDNPNANPRDLTTVYVLQAYSSLSTFEIELGITAADKAISIGEEYSLDYFEAWGRACAGMLKMQQGDLDEAIRHYKRSLL
jgi:ATP/maltotriose-dependent transcriptional regulator MalT